MIQTVRKYTAAGRTKNNQRKVEKMRDDFAVFILTHGRADNVYTLKTLKQSGYTGKWYMIVDDEDEQEELYIENFGAEHVIKFCKQDVYNAIDTMDNFNDHNVIIYARNVCWEIARKLGLKYFLQFDDDYTDIEYRWEERGKLRVRGVSRADALFGAMIQFLDVSNADTVAFAQGGDFVGGLNGGNFKKGLLRKAMNSFFCRADRPIEFKGTMNEDVVMYTLFGSQGHLMLSLTRVNIVQKQTQASSGGMSEKYLESGTYVKSFYSVIAMPSAVKVALMTSRHKRVHHKVDWTACVPKILNEKWKKESESKMR